MIRLLLAIGMLSVASAGLKAQDPASPLGSGDDPFSADAVTDDPIDQDAAWDNPFGDGSPRCDRPSADVNQATNETNPCEPAARHFVAPSQTDTLTRLRGRTDFDFFETPLTEAIVYFEDQHGLQFVVDTVALDADGISSNAPLTYKLSKVPLETALQVMLQPLKLTIRVEQGIVIVTTLDQAESQPMTKVYSVTALIHPDTEWRSVDQVVEVITTTASPDTWEENGGCGRIAYLQGQLIVTNTYTVLREVAELLDELSARIAARGGPGKVDSR